MKIMIRVNLVRTLVVICCVGLLQTLVPINAMAQQTAPDPAASFELGESPLSENEMDQLMLWIAAEVGAARVPYCYRQSFGRGAGEFPNAGCRPDQELNGVSLLPEVSGGLRWKRAGLLDAVSGRAHGYRRFLPEVSILYPRGRICSLGSEKMRNRKSAGLRKKRTYLVSQLQTRIYCRSHRMLSKMSGRLGGHSYRLHKTLIRTNGG